VEPPARAPEPIMAPPPVAAPEIAELPDEPLFAAAPPPPVEKPVAPTMLSQPALEQKLAPVEEPVAPVFLMPTPSLPPSEEREAVLPRAEVMLPELSSTEEPPSWVRARREADEEHEAETSAPALVAKPAEEAKPVEPLLLASASSLSGEAMREPQLTVPPMAAGPKAVIDLLSAETSSEPPAAPAEPAAAQPVAAAPAEAEAKSAADDILDYWDKLRGTQDVPVLRDLDRGHVAQSWPNTVLLAFNSTEAPRITRVGANNGDVEYTAMVTDWIMTRGRNSAKRGQPMEEEQRFPVSGGRARYRLLMLPFSSDGSVKSDHVLCHISRAQDRSAVDSFKRWLAS